MIYSNFFDPINSNHLFNLENDFNFLSSLYTVNKLPKILMLSGKKGSGKFTLVNHFLCSIFDEKNYNKKNLSYSLESNFYNQIRNNTFPNIVYLKGADFKSIKIDDIRNLKTQIYQTSILNKDRFIVFDDIELFNTNSLNALLKIIEEPCGRNFFILINNKSKPLLETIQSRSLEIKIILKESQRLDIINKLKLVFKLEDYIDPKKTYLTPGNFLKFNYICREYNILENDFLKNISLLINIYKKNKDTLFLNVIFFLADLYIRELLKKRKFKNEKIFEIKNEIFNSLNDFLKFNINQNVLINSLEKKIK